jgi:hypothetical protein
MAGKNGRLNPGDIAVAVPNVAGPPPKMHSRPHRSPPAPWRSRPARASAQRRIAPFFAANVRAVKNTSLRVGAARVRSFAAPPAVKRCVASSNANDGGDSALTGLGAADGPAPVAAPEFVVAYGPRPCGTLFFHRPQKEEGAGEARHHSGPPASFRRFPPESGR